MLLNTTALTKTYTISGNLITALNAVDLTFSENSFTCIVGKSGCGKTTLLRLLSGLESATSGTINYGKAAKIGFVFQEPRLMPWLTVNANIAFAAKNDPSLPAAPDEELLELLGLKAFQHSYPSQLSGGMAQRTALGRTLFQNPDLILMDEPFSALDYFTRRSLQQMLLALFQQQKKSVIFVTHDVEEHYC
jgi:sulfonate transport system ATP-binding protein